MTSKPETKTLDFIEVHNWDDVPEFTTEREEADFWATHALSEKLMEESLTDDDLGLPPPRARTSPVSIRFDTDSLTRLKALARRRHKGYQTLLKEFVIERLYEEEKREGIVGA